MAVITQQPKALHCFVTQTQGPPSLVQTFRKFVPPNLPILTRGILKSPIVGGGTK